MGPKGPRSIINQGGPFKWFNGLCGLSPGGRVRRLLSHTVHLSSATCSASPQQKYIFISLRLIVSIKWESEEKSNYGVFCASRTLSEIKREKREIYTYQTPSLPCPSPVLWFDWNWLCAKNLHATRIAAEITTRPPKTNPDMMGQPGWRGSTCNLTAAGDLPSANPTQPPPPLVLNH